MSHHKRDTDPSNEERFEYQYAIDEKLKQAYEHGLKKMDAGRFLSRWEYFYSTIFWSL